MKKIFVDTDVLVALNRASDSHHQRAVKILENLSKTRTVSYTSTNVLLETLTIISQRIGKKKAVQLLDELRGSRYNVIHPSEKIVSNAEEIFRSTKSKNISYSDCLSFAIMRNTGINHVFSFDIHFKKQGFRRVGID